jgi:hypothetical protein
VIRLLAKFAPEEGAPPAVVRRVGARNAFLGAVLIVFGVMVVLALDRIARGALLDPLAEKPSKLRAVSGVPVVIGFVALVVGLYRAITGVHPERDGKTALARVGRLLVATLIAATVLAAITVAVIAVASRPGPGRAP